MKLPFFFSAFRKDLQVIEKEIAHLGETESVLLRQTTQHLMQSGGKRIRPIFVLLCAKFGEYDMNRVKYPAAALELIHSASLAHDDVIDQASLRRGKPTIGAKWGNDVATYTGDFIFAHAMQLIAKIEDPVAHQIVADAIVEVCKGELDQIHDKYDFDQDLHTYLRRIKRKTALLIAISGQLGAVAAGVSGETHRKLYKFGYYVGMSYQIIDDILDFTGTEKELGKPAGGDLLQGNITLPTLIAMKDQTLRAQIITVHAQMAQEDLVPILDAIRRSGAIKESYRVSQRYLNKAFAILDDFPDSKHKKNLYDVAKYIGRRTN